MASYANISRDPALSKFIDALLVPSPPESLVDTAYNSQLRQDRQINWRNAFRQYKFWKALDEAALSITMLAKIVVPAGLVLPSRDVCMHEVRKAYAALLRTPAYDRTSVAWKKRQKTGGYYGFEAEELSRIIEDDEAFLDATPVTRRPRRPRSKRT